MSRDHDIADESARLDRMFRAKAQAEIAAAERLSGPTPLVRGQGDGLAEVLLVKGEPGSDDLATGRALAGADGSAAGKALDALGLPSARFAFCTRASDVGAADRVTRIRMLLEAIDPSVILALDTLAAHDLAEATGSDPLVAGTPTLWGGRTVLALDGLEASLGDEALKRRVWQQLKSLARAERED